MLYVHPDYLHDHWEFVKEGLTRIHDRASDRWKPEDVYSMLKANSAGLYIINDNDGFCILQPVKGWDGQELFVFAAYLKPGHDFMDESFEEVKQIGRNMNAKRIKFQSKRAGWHKRAIQLGYEFGHIEYEVSL